jgi:hypothetical protein
MMIKGQYVVYKNGKEISRQNNVVTNFGKDAILRYLCGAISNWSGALAVGVGNTAAIVSDTRLAFELSRNIVTLRAPSYSIDAAVAQTQLTNNIVTLTTNVNHGFAVGQSITVSGCGSPYDGTYTITSVPLSNTLTYAKTNANVVVDDIEPYGTITSPLRQITLQTTLDSALSGVIYESAIYTSLGFSGLGNFDGRIITFFSEGLNASGDSDPLLWSYSAGMSVDTTNSRIGNSNIYLPSGTTTILGGTSTVGSLVLDLTGYQPNDQIQFAHYLSASSTGSISITMTDSQGYTMSKTFSYTNATGYKIENVSLKDWTYSNSDFNYVISKITVSSTGINTSLDGIRVDDTETIDTNNGLVSRAVFDTPVTKYTGDIIDVEYILTLDI